MQTTNYSKLNHYLNWLETTVSKSSLSIVILSMKFVHQYNDSVGQGRPSEVEVRRKSTNRGS